LIGGQVRRPRIVDHPAVDPHGRAIGVDLSQSGRVIAEQLRRLSEFLLRFRASWPLHPEGEHPPRVEKLLIIDQRVLGPVQLFQDFGDRKVIRRDIVLPLQIAWLALDQLLIQSDSALKLRQRKAGGIRLFFQKSPVRVTRRQV
jgi:hypothetical protein